LALGAAISSIGCWGVRDGWSDEHGLRQLIDSEDEGTFALERVPGDLWKWYDNFRDLSWGYCCPFIDDVNRNYFFSFFGRNLDWTDTARVSDSNIVTIALFKFPKTHITSCCLFIIMLVRVGRREPSRAQIAKV
jgi:hypothetical protein